VKTPTKTTLTLLAILALALPALAGSNFRLEFDQTGTSHTVGAYTITESFKDYYMGSSANFAGSSEAIANSDLTGGASHLFLVQNSNGVGLVVVHNKMNAGVAGEAEMQLDFVPDANCAIVHEDGPEGNSGDWYEDNVALSSNGRSVLAQWKWGQDYTDGMVVSWEPTHGDYVDIQFKDLQENVSDPDAQDPGYDAHAGIANWYFHAPGQTDPIHLNLNSTVRLTAVPLPPAAWPVVGMLAAIGLKKWRSRPRELTDRRG
jgi:hypothetical protein